MTGPLDDTLADVTADVDFPCSDDQLTFEAPWQARAFALAVVLHRRDRIQWNKFQQNLTAVLQEQGDDDLSESAYYRCWITALERTLSGELVGVDALRTRVEAFETGERDASEFVVGVEHDHDHG